MKIKSQWMDAEMPRQGGFPPSVVQSGMSPSISQMIKTRRVGGNVDAYEMDGEVSDAPFESEYIEIFDILDQSQEMSKTAPERKGAEKTPEKAAPQSTENQQDKME